MHDTDTHHTEVHRRHLGGLLGRPRSVEGGRAAGRGHRRSLARGPDAVRGRRAYIGKIAELVGAVPDLRLHLVDSATVPGGAAGEELVFLHYTGTGTAASGPITIRGMDRVRTRDGIVVENVIRYDATEPDVTAL